MSGTDCSHILRELEAYADHELDAEHAEHVKRHLEGCSPCMDHAEFREHLRELISRKCCSEEVPNPVTERIRLLLEAEPGR